MIEAWPTDAVYAAESSLMERLGPGELMARAVEGLVEVALARVKQLGARRVVALVGTGNNGADALYAAAGLAAGSFPGALFSAAHDEAHSMAAGMIARHSFTVFMRQPPFFAYSSRLPGAGRSALWKGKEK